MLLCAALLLAACSDGEPPTPTSLQATAQAPASAVAVSVVLVGVKVLDGQGKPMKGVNVSFEVTGGGSVTTPSAVSDAQGVAPASWTLSTTTGANTLIARVAGVEPLTFTVTVTADAATHIVAATGNPTAGVAGSVLSPAPGIRVTDRHGNAVVGMAVTFSPNSGTVTAGQQVTNADGVARPASWTLGGPAGLQTMNAVAGTLSTSLAVSVSPGPPSVVQTHVGNNQSAQPGASLPIRPAVRVTDAFNNPIAGVTVTFEVTAGGGSIAGATQVSDGFGVATLGGWTLGIPTEPTALRLDKFAGDNTTCPVSSTQCSFTVRVTSDPTTNTVRARIASGASAELTAFATGSASPSGHTVVWTNGALTQSTVTNAQGRTTLRNLGTSGAPSTGTQKARLQSSGSEVTFSYQLVTSGQFNIDVRFLGTVPESQQLIATAAKQRWEAVVLSDLPAITMSGQNSSCGISHPAMNEVVDDVVIWVSIVPIDGPGNVLGSAAPCWVRSGGAGRLPIVGVVRLDSADVAAFEQNGSLRDLLIHEMGHVLGFGSMWGDAAFSHLVGGIGGNDPHFVGARAVPSFQLTGGILVNGVPIEASGGPGTAGSHWRETTFARELMTGFLTGGVLNPLSVITIGSLMDMGYQVNFGAADDYVMPGAVAGARTEGDVANVVRLVEVPLPPPRIIR